MAREIRTPAGGRVVYALRLYTGDYAVFESRDCETTPIGYMRRHPGGGRPAWMIATNIHDDLTGRYADMSHAAEGILNRRAT